MGSMLQAAHTQLEVEDMDYPYPGKEIPEMTVRVAMPKIMGFKTEMFGGWPNHMLAKRKVIHVECGEEDGGMVKMLTNKVKEMGLIKRMWASKSA